MENKIISNLYNIKSVYSIKIIFEYIKKNKYYEIIKYNKKIQNRLNLTVNDYKEYSQLYSSIEIQLKLVKNTYSNQAFINVTDNNKKYFHIFFNDSNKEVNLSRLNHEKIEKVKIIIEHRIISFGYLFLFCNRIEEIYFKKFYRTNIIDMSSMFSGCASLTTIDMSNLITNNVTNMQRMFNGCESLKELNLFNYNTNNVTNMSYMFNRCLSLKELNLENINTSKVNDMSHMFEEYKSLTNLNVSSFNTDKVTNMDNMFFGCSNILLDNVKLQNNSFKDINYKKKEKNENNCLIILININISKLKSY